MVENAKQVLLHLNRSGIDYALCGGLALAAHGHPRATSDIDCLFPDLETRDRSVRILDELGWIDGGSRLEFEDGSSALRLIRGSGPETVILYLIAQAPEARWLEDRERAELEGASYWVIGRRGLIDMEMAAGRPQDLADIARARRKCSLRTSASFIGRPPGNSRYRHGPPPACARRAWRS